MASKEIPATSERSIDNRNYVNRIVMLSIPLSVLVHNEIG